MAEKITGKPVRRVSNLSIERGSGTSYALTAKWKVGSSLTSTTGDAGKTRTTHFVIRWTVTRVNAKGKESKVIVTRKTSGTDTTQTTFNPCNFSVTKTTGKGAKQKTVTTAYTRRSYYPYTSARLKSVTVTVWAANGIGMAKTGVSKTYAFVLPGFPTITDLSQSEDTGHICFTINAFDWSKGNKERIQTAFEIKRTVVKPDPDNPGHMKTSKWVPSEYSGTFTGAKREYTDDDAEGAYHVDALDRFNIGYDGYVAISVHARSLGLRGDSKTAKGGAWSRSKTIYVSYPTKPTIKSVAVDKVVAENLPAVIQDTGMVTIAINTNQGSENGKVKPDTRHPITGLRLQKLVSTTATTAAQAIALSAEWEDTDIVDDWHCTALSTSVAELKPTRGTHTWVRVKCWNQFEDMFFRYSDPVEVADLYNDPLSSSGSATIRSIHSGSDGKSLAVSVGWNEVGEIPMTGTEISWSTNEKAWRSNEEPQTYEFEWSDEKDPVADADFDGVALAYIGGLEQGKLYYVRARRYHDDDEGERTYGAYSDVYRSTPVSSPSSVVLNVPPYIARGRDVVLTWSYDSEAEQTEWHVQIGSSQLVDVNDGDESTDPSSQVREWVSYVTDAESGTDALGTCVIPYERIEPYIVDDQVSFAVTMGTGGELVSSDIAVMRFVDPPTLSLTVPATVTAQPLELALASNVRAGVVLIVRAGTGTGDGNSGTDQTPGRCEDQADGDVVWQAPLTPEWTQTDGVDGYTATVRGPEYPHELALLDNGSYTVTARATDNETGLTSDEVSATFAVAWAHQAPKVSEETSVVPFDMTDEYGVRTRGCVITLVEPDDALESDVSDVYRLTPDGAYLIAESVSTQAEVTDEYAPYGEGETGYRVVTRTTDGDIDWLDVSYDAPGKDLRIDFDGEYVELPWNLSLSDSYTKDFEARRKLDGSIDGYWNGGIERKAGFSTDLIRIREQDRAAAVRRLARHVGPCFVRTPDGCAYMADVQVNDLSGARNEAALAVSIDATEIGLTDEYRGRVPDEESGTEPDEEGGEG